LAEEFVERYRQGERPPLSEYTARYPEHAEQIRDLFPALVMMEQIAPGSECSAPSSAGTLRQRPGEHPEQIGDYRILREIGRGGMGIVYEAEQVSLGRHVALKVLPRQLLPGSKQQQRFEQEARSAARLHHTNIVPVFGVGEQGGLHYYAMQYIQGSGLDEVLDELRRLRRGKGSPGTEPAAEEAWAARGDASAEGVARSLLSGAFELPSGGTGDQMPGGVAEVPSETAALSASSMILPGWSGDGRKSRGRTYWHSVAHIGAQVAGALAYAHQQGVLHRDIKPANLLLDTQGIVWVTDFGLAKAGDQEGLTHTGDVLGTLRYLAPERFQGRADARSEVYALGLTLYELLALRPAFDESDRHQLIRQVLGGEWVRLEKVNPAIPRDLVTIVHKALDRDPACRYQTAKELGDDLQCFLDDAPIKARRLWLAEQVLRWARHHKGLAAALAVIALLLVAVTLGSSLAAIRLQTLADEAERGPGRSAGNATGRTSRWRPAPCNCRTPTPPDVPSTRPRRSTATGSGDTCTSNWTARRPSFGATKIPSGARSSAPTAKPSSLSPTMARCATGTGQPARNSAGCASLKATNTGWLCKPSHRFSPGATPAFVSSICGQVRCVRFRSPFQSRSVRCPSAQTPDSSPSALARTRIATFSTGRQERRSTSVVTPSRS
jgi:serine/threonine protein kinase